MPQHAIYRSPPTTTNANFDGIGEQTSDCVSIGCVMPDPTVAVSTTQIAETAMERLEVYDKSGNALCGISLNNLLGTAEPLWDVRIQYDNVNNRYSMIVGVVVPNNSVAAPATYIAASTSSDACGSWFVYRVTFNGGSYPPGAQLDGHFLGQDRQAVLVSTDNNCCLRPGVPYQYIGSAAFAIPKSALYSGAGFSFGSFAVSLGTSPVTVAGIPMETTTNTYFLASVPGTGYNLYRMTNSGGPGTSLVLQASISSPFSAPSREAFQPGGAASPFLFPGDGHLTSAPVQAGGAVWFTHVMDLGGFPAIRYGVVITSTNSVTAAVAYHSGSSDDFDPSIAVSEAPSGGVHIWLNWAYTDWSLGVAASDTIDGVTPGAGVPSLIGTGLTTVNGVTANGTQSFGWYSSVAVDPASAGPGCPAGNTAVAVQQYFAPFNSWSTRIARTSFC